MRNLKLCILLAAAFMPTLCYSQNDLAECKKQLGEFLTQLGARESQIGRIGINDVKDSTGTLFFFASENCAYISFNESNVSETYSALRSFLPEKYNGRRLAIYTQDHEISDYIPLAKRSKPKKDKTAKFVRPDVCQLVRKQSSPVNPDKGLAGKHIVVWPSHGRYYEPKLTRWEWQRARMFQTVEDLYTRSYVMPFLVPMLENAGANVLIPRERDTQTEEIIVDNDKGVDSGSSYTENAGKEPWNTGKGKGFAHLREFYKDFENPFTDGTYREALTVGKKDTSSIIWKPQIKKAGEYAVYVSYKTVENSTEDASYTVFHRGIATQFKQ